MKTRELQETARAFRREFDASFAAAPPVERPSPVGFLSLRLGGDPYALGLADIAGLHRDWRVVPVASHAPQLMGIAGSRGILVPVYDLGALLGYPPERDARWVVTLRAPHVALAFARFEGHAQVLPEAVSPHAGASAHVRGTVVVEGASRPILRVDAVVDVIVRRGAQP